MRNWSPEPFRVDPDSVVRTAPVRDGFVSDGPVVAPTGGISDDDSPEWLPATPFVDVEAGAGESRAGTLAHERARTELQEKFVAERAALEAAHAAELARCREESRANFAAWAAAFSEATERRRSRDAPRLAKVALAMAEKIVRAAVAADPSVLIGTIETVLFKIERDVPLTVTVHPDDAAWLEQNPETMAVLRVGEVVADRRVSRGGCRVSAAGREWDASLESQLQALSEAAATVLDGGKGADHAP